MMEIHKVHELWECIRTVPSHLLTMNHWNKIDEHWMLHPAVWASMEPWFQDVGLEHHPETGTPVYGKDEGMDALYYFFGIDQILVDMMFKAEHYPEPGYITKEHIVARIGHVLTILESGVELKAA